MGDNRAGRRAKKTVGQRLKAAAESFRFYVDERAFGFGGGYFWGASLPRNLWAVVHGSVFRIVSGHHFYTPHPWAGRAHRILWLSNFCAVVSGCSSGAVEGFCGAKITSKRAAAWGGDEDYDVLGRIFSRFSFGKTYY